ncbi:MAG TPA: hypothetical protein VI583_01160 [Cyclobacteriaceae bacterium]|nr:hypothetical protein [Cyclobacteriaceae bacterium]
MKSRIIIYLTVIALLSACGHKQSEHNHADDAVAEEHDHDSGTPVLELDSGKKWVVNPEMMVHIRNMEKDVKQFDGTSLSAYKELSGKLKEYNLQITASCTMKGKSHEELHDWLLPFIDLTKKLGESGSETQASENFNQVKKSINTFNEYFE